MINGIVEAKIALLLQKKKKKEAKIVKKDLMDHQNTEVHSVFW